MDDSSPNTASNQPVEDSDRDEIEEKKAQPSSQLNPLYIIGGVGCVLILCLILLGGSGLLVYLTSSSDAEEMTTNTVESETETEVSQESKADSELDPTATTSASSSVDTEDASTNTSASDSFASSSDDTATTGADPELGQLAFSQETTDEAEAINSDFLFEEGIDTLHATFEYANLASSNIWTQIWYHNGSEISSTSQPWLEADSGTYDYVIEAGGEPLPAGEWTLEFYIDDELLTAGSFTIENELTDDEETDSIEIAKVYQLAYTKFNGEKHDLYIGDTTGNNEQFIMSRAAGPSWSPDGQFLFFFGEDGVDQQYVNGVMYPLASVGSGIARVTVNPVPANVEQIQIFQGRGWNDGTGRWASASPDGAMVAYDGDRGGGRRIYFLGSNDNQQFKFELIGEQADWAPDSQRVVYRSGRDNKTGIWISNRDDSGHRPITNSGTDSFPTWSFDGKTIAFSREVEGNVDIYTVNVDGSKLTRLTNAQGQDTLPSFMPNGDIVFRSARTGSWTIWTMQGDGSDQTMIIADAGVGPEWSFSKMDVLR